MLDIRLIRENPEAVERGLADRGSAELVRPALAQDAEIVLMDEPLTGLDVASQNGIFGLLRGLTERGVTLLVSTHDLDVASERFARIMLLNRSLVAFGTPADVMRPELLLPTFGGHASVQAGERDKVVVYDTCCDGGETHGEPHHDTHGEAEKAASSTSGTRAGL